MICEELGVTTIREESDSCYYRNTLQNFRVDKNSYSAERNSDFLGLSQYNIFTDGSKMDGKVGSGYQLWKQEHVQRSW